MILDREIRALLAAAEHRLEHGTPEDRYRVASVFHAVLGPDATLNTLEWGVDYLRTDPAVHRPPPRLPGPIPLPASADVPQDVRDAYEQGQQADARVLAGGEDLDVEHDQDAEVERHRADPWKGAVAPPPIGNATAFGFGLPSTTGERG